MAVLFSYAVRAWKATTPELNGHRPQIAGNRNAERIARPSPPCKALIPLTATQLPYVPTGVRRAPRACARERRPAFGSRRRTARRPHAAGYGDTTPYDKRPAELHNPRITQATYMSIWESAHLAGRRCRVGIGPPCRAPLSCGNRPTLAPLPCGNPPILPGAAAVWKPPILPGAAAVWESAHLAERCCRVGIGPPCRAPVLCGNPPTLPGAAVVGIGPPCRAPVLCGNRPSLPGAAAVWE
jgi:hypothetical protein